jgi:hypothetical protein
VLRRVGIFGTGEPRTTHLAWQKNINRVWDEAAPDVWREYVAGGGVGRRHGGAAESGERRQRRRVDRQADNELLRLGRLGRGGLALGPAENGFGGTADADLLPVSDGKRRGEHGRSGPTCAFQNSHHQIQCSATSRSVLPSPRPLLLPSCPGKCPPRRTHSCSSPRPTRSLPHLWPHLCASTSHPRSSLV